MSEPNNIPSCAHLRVAYRTEDVGDGSVRGFWVCENGCGATFLPELLFHNLKAERDRQYEENIKQIAKYAALETERDDLLQKYDRANASLIRVMGERDEATLRIIDLNDAHDEEVGKIRGEIDVAEADLCQYPTSEALPVKLNWLRFSLAALGVKKEPK